MPLAERWLHQLVMIGFAVFNPLFLPFGLFWSHLLAPVSLLYVAKWSWFGIKWLYGLTLLLVIYSTLILSERDVHFQDYLVGLLVLLAGVVFATYVYYLIAYRLRNVRRLFFLVLKFYTALLAFGLLMLVADQEDCCWIPADFGDFPRLQLAFYEPSHLAFVAVPFVLYGALVLIETKGRCGGWPVFAGVFLLVMTQSLSVFGLFVPALVIAAAPRLLKALTNFRVLFVAVGLVIFLALSPSGIEKRLQALTQVGDHSGQVRVFYSTLTAVDLVQDQHAWLLGVGIGQPKYYVEYYASAYSGYASNRLPNAVASTIAAVGFAGLTVKWLILLFLAMRTRVFSDDYGRGLFIFTFLYQFVGGYFNNVNEFVLFGIAFGHGMKRRLEDSRSTDRQGPEIASRFWWQQPEFGDGQNTGYLDHDFAPESNGAQGLASVDRDGSVLLDR